MKFCIEIYEYDNVMAEKAHYIQSFSEHYLENYFLNNNYGHDVLEISISTILIKSTSGFELFFKARKPIYIQHQEFFNELNNCRWEWNKRFMIEIRFDNDVYDSFLKADEKESNSILARETLKALEQLDKLPKRLKDFDKEAFKRDVKALYASYGWI